MEEIFINIDSKYRDRILYPAECKFRINLEKTYKNITAVTINSLELCNSINYISTKKNNNYIKIHLPNKLNDPDGTTIILVDGLLQLITSIKSIFNGILSGIFNTNGALQTFSYNDQPFAEKYFYIFYLNNDTPIVFDFNSADNMPNSLSSGLIIKQGWHSIYGIVIQINKYIKQKYNERKEYVSNINTNSSSPPTAIPLDAGNFSFTPISLNIFDRRFRHKSSRSLDCIRVDIIAGAIFTADNLDVNLQDVKTRIYQTYINDIVFYITKPVGSPVNSTFGILDKLASGTFVVVGDYSKNINGGILSSNSKYYINSVGLGPNSDNTQIYNLSNEIDLTGLRVYFKNSFSNVTVGTTLKFYYYYYVDQEGNNTATWKYIENGNTVNYVENLLSKSFLLKHKFITQEEHDNPFYNATLEKDIADFQIDFNTNKTLENPVTNGLVDIKKLEYASVGHYIGYRPDILKPIDKFLKFSVMDETDRIIRAEKMFDTGGDNYIFIKINGWGYIDFFGEPFMAKILLTSGLGNPKLDAFVNQGYRFRQPVNINRLDIELVDFLGNTLDLNGFDFSTSLKLMTVISSDQKDILERQALVFTY